MDELLNGLNPEQKKAVLHQDGPLLILAGAGSGKTRVLTHRIAYLIDEHHVSPYQILALTFTNKAAGEMRERVDNLVEIGADNIWVSTFHSTCVRILRRYADRLGYERDFSIYDADDQKALMKDILRTRNLDPKKYKERTFINEISRAKDELKTPEEFAVEVNKEFNKRLYGEIYIEYQKRLKTNNAFDFDDLIFKTVELFKNVPDVLEYYQERFRYILVDEYQDTNTAQFTLLSLLASKYRNLCVVGDDDQSIYKFRGANIYNILNFEKVFPDTETIRLEQNYRSTKNILEAASEVIKNNHERKIKTLWAESEQGAPIRYAKFESDYDEASGVAGDISKSIRDNGYTYSDFAILYRTNAQSRIFEEKLVYEGIPYRIVGAINFYARKEIKDLLCYLKTISNGADDIAVKRIINVPKRGIGDTSIGRISTYALDNDISFYEALTKADYIPGIGRSASGVSSFVGLIENYKQKLRSESGYNLEKLIRDIIDDTGYVSDLENENSPEADARIENIESLISKIVQYEAENEEPTLGGLLEDIALVADIDTVDNDADQVLLMTLHSAKGLEFENVYIVGMEEGIFPGGSAIFGGNDSELEEERRLCYVGITRAKKHLTLTGADRRMRNGNTEFNRPSRFIHEIPRHLLHMSGSAPSPAAASSYGSTSTGYSSSGTKSTSYTGNPYVSRKKANIFADNPYISKGGATSSSTAPDYTAGDQVSHIKFGEGTVISITPSGSDYEVEVEFEDFGKRKLKASFAKLKKI
ncbi:MAG: DNA helicase PcrA [Eubacterium sp.]|nr:DNA helicase PcrA [Eubacterium sp.]